MKKTKFSLHCCIIIFLCIITGGFLVTLANYLPIAETQKNNALSQLASEGYFPEVPSMQGSFGDFHTMNPTGLELATDNLMVKMALYEGEDEGIIQAFRCYSTQYEEEYSRYWHGYVIILRILLFFFNYYEIRIINSICQFLLFAACAFYLWKNKGVKYALALATSYALLMPMALSQCLQYTWVFYITFLALFVYFYHRQFWEQENRYIYFFILVGASINFLDLLTYPLLTWGVAILWWILLQEKEDSILGYLKKVVFSGIAWIAGYAGMWMGKWVLGSMILRENLFKKVFSEALLWTVSEGEDAITLADRFKAMFTNWSVYDYKIYFLILIIWLLYWTVHGLQFQHTTNSKAPALLLIGLSSLVWYFCLAGHALMHHIFTHRTYGVSIAAFLGIILLSTDAELQVVNWKKHLLRRILTLSAILAISTFLMLQVRDDYNHYNGQYAFTDIELTSSATTLFSPIYPDVTALNLGLAVTNGTEGYLKLELLDGDTLLHELTLPFEEYAKKTFHTIPVDWELEVNHPYTIRMEPVGNNGNIQIKFTSDGSLPLPEYSELHIGNESIPGQLLAGVTYWCALKQTIARVLFIFTFICICMMLLYVYYSVMEYFQRRKRIPTS